MGDGANGIVILLYPHYSVGRFTLVTVHPTSPGIRSSSWPGVIWPLLAELLHACAARLDGDDIGTVVYAVDVAWS